MYQIGFDVGGTNLKVGAVHNNMEIAARRNFAFPKGETYEKIAEQMAEQVIDLAKELKIPVTDFKSIGIATAQGRSLSMLIISVFTTYQW